MVYFAMIALIAPQPLCRVQSVGGTEFFSPRIYTSIREGFARISFTRNFKLKPK